MGKKIGEWLEQELGFEFAVENRSPYKRPATGREKNCFFSDPEFALRPMGELPAGYKLVPPLHPLMMSKRPQKQTRTPM